jgi:hypothetical protein
MLCDFWSRFGLHLPASSSIVLSIGAIADRYILCTVTEILNWSHVNRPMSLRNLVQLAIEKRITNSVNVGPNTEWMHIRNEAVHSNISVTNQQAKVIVESVLDLFPDDN